MKKIFVLGSINTDYLVNTSRLPLLGESKEGHDFLINQGGKGANQAIACKRLGGSDVYLIACVGRDNAGSTLRAEVEKNGINTQGFQSAETNSGSCVIVFDEEKKDNILVIDKGANECLDYALVESFLKENATSGDIFITQLETNIDVIYKSLHLAKSLGMYTILNPAPAKELNKEIFKDVDLIIPNETECLNYTNIMIKDEKDIKVCYKYFKEFGIKDLIITLGSKGSYYISDNLFIHQDIFVVDVVDTTCAGDTFIGGIAAMLAKGYRIEDALAFAAKASSITVSRRGAGKSIPYLEEID